MQIEWYKIGFAFVILTLFLIAINAGKDFIDHKKLPAAPRGISIDTFVEDLQLPEQKPVDIGIDDPIGNVRVFSISYGVPSDCEAGCFSSYAVGIQHKDKIGLMSYRDYDDLDPSKFVMYDFDFSDAYLFSFKFAWLLESKNEWIYEKVMEGLQNAPLIVKWQIKLRKIFIPED